MAATATATIHRASNVVCWFVCVCVMYELQNGINGCNRIRQPKNGELQQNHQQRQGQEHWQQRTCEETHWIASILVKAYTMCLSFLLSTTHHLHQIELHSQPSKKNFIVAQTIQMERKLPFHCIEACLYVSNALETAMWSAENATKKRNTQNNCERSDWEKKKTRSEQKQVNGAHDSNP